VDAFAVARFVIGVGFLGVAAFLDVRTRRVRDPLWIAMGTMGLALLAVELAWTNGVMNDWLLLGSAAILFYAVFFGRPLLDEDRIHLRPFRILILAAAAIGFLAALIIPVLVSTGGAGGNGELARIARLASMPIMILLYQGFYQLGLLRGGADAKAMMALTLLVPAYPDASPYPLLTMQPNVLQAMQVFFPYSLVVLVNAAILFLAVPLAYLILNAIRGDLDFPQALFGTRAPIDRLPPHVWLMERVDRHGERVAVLFPAHREDESGEVAKLKAAGATRVWVQPKVPFLVPLFIGFLLAFFAGNLMLAFLTALLPHP
jgi:preflagellin peptidase FlaK